MQQVTLRETRCDTAEGDVCRDHSSHEHRLIRSETDIRDLHAEDGRLHERVDQVIEKMDNFKNLLIGTLLSSLFAGVGTVVSLVVALASGEIGRASCRERV
jgi:hypothetical protein